MFCRKFNSEYQLWLSLRWRHCDVALKILPNASKMARAEQWVDTSFSSYYYSFAKSGWERLPSKVWEVALGFASLGVWGALLV